MTPMEIDRAHDILGVIDVQPTFMPGGELPVADGDAVVPVINRLTRSVFARAFATQDWHPADHASFASRHPGRAPFDMIDAPYGRQTLWPDHAIIGTPNASLHPALDTRIFELILRKGMRPAIDSYSAFTENDRSTTTGLAAWLAGNGIRRVFLAGLALDFCVAWTAEDAAACGFETWVIEDACRAIAAPVPAGAGGTTWDAARARLTGAGVRLIQSAALIGHG